MESHIRITVGALIMCILVVVVLFYGAFRSSEVVATTTEPEEMMASPEFTAASWIIFEVASGEVLAEKDADTKRPIASVTKLIAASQYHARNELEDTVTVTWDDLSTEGEAGKLSYGDIYTAREMLIASLLESSNDAAQALARTDPGLIDAMNEYAASLGLDDTSFADASGLSSRNVSTARELAVLLQDIQDHTPHIIDITRLQEYYTKDNGWLNNNPAIGFERYRGGKHGYTPEAGRTFTGFFEDGRGREIGMVLLGSDDIASDIDVFQEYMR